MVIEMLQELDPEKDTNILEVKSGFTPPKEKPSFDEPLEKEDHDMVLLLQQHVGEEIVEDKKDKKEDEENIVTQHPDVLI